LSQFWQVADSDMGRYVDAAGIRLYQTENAFNQRAFAGAVGAEKAGNRALFQAKRCGYQRLDALIRLAKVATADVSHYEFTKETGQPMPATPISSVNRLAYRQVAVTTGAAPFVMPVVMVAILGAASVAV